MLLCEINPYVRFACRIVFKSEKVTFNVFDCRLFYIIKGSIEIVIEEEKYTLTEGSVFYCCATSCYRIQSDECTLLSLNFDLSQKRNSISKCIPPRTIEDEEKAVFNEKELVDDCSFLNSHLFIPSGVRYYDYIKDIVDELLQETVFFREKASSILKSLLIDICRLSQKKGSPQSLVVDEASNFIRDNYKQKITNDKLASAAGYHEYHLNRLFVRFTGMSIHKYIISIRVGEAKKLLVNTDMPQSDISSAVGFSSPAHFSDCFKKSVGISPSEYRKQFRSKI